MESNNEVVLRLTNDEAKVLASGWGVVTSELLYYRDELDRNVVERVMERALDLLDKEMSHVNTLTQKIQPILDGLIREALAKFGSGRSDSNA